MGCWLTWRLIDSLRRLTWRVRALRAAQMAYNVDVVKTAVPEALEVLVDSVVNPKFLVWEVADAVAKMREDIKTVKDNPQTVLLEVRACPGRASQERVGLQLHACTPIIGWPL